jgi:hypothetical protein
MTSALVVAAQEGVAPVPSSTGAWSATGWSSQRPAHVCAATTGGGSARGRWGLWLMDIVGGVRLADGRGQDRVRHLSCWRLWCAVGRDRSGFEKCVHHVAPNLHTDGR